MTAWLVRDLHGQEAVLEHRPGRPTDVPVVQLDVSALRTLIGFDPRDLAGGLGAQRPGPGL